MPGTERSKVAILGCGRSILDLTKDQREFVNSIPIRIGLNKYAAFHEIAGIKPTHIWFTDFHPPNAEILQYVLDTAGKSLRDIIAIVVEPLREGKRGTFELPPVCYVGPTTFALARAFNKIRFVRRPLSRTRFFRLPPSFKVEKVQIGDWLGTNSWAKNRNEPLFQFLTSFTSALNYVSVNFPNHDIVSVGTDFNQGGYFFDDAIKERKLSWSDWTTKPQLEAKRHSSMIDLTGKGTLIDRMPYIVEQLAATHNRLFCSSPHSELVLRGFATLTDQ